MFWKAKDHQNELVIRRQDSENGGWQEGDKECEICKFVDEGRPFVNGISGGKVAWLDMEKVREKYEENSYMHISIGMTDLPILVERAFIHS